MCVRVRVCLHACAFMQFEFACVRVCMHACVCVCVSVCMEYKYVCAFVCVFVNTVCVYYINVYVCVEAV